MFSQLRHHLSLLNPEERLPLKKYEHVALSNFKTTSIKCKATIFNAACVDAVFDVDLDCRIKDLKKLYSKEASNPYSDMLYAIDPEKDERPNPIGDGFAPASVLTLVDEEGRQFADEELLFSENIGESNPECYLEEFTAQVFIATFEVDMPELAQYLEGESDTEAAWKCVRIIRGTLFEGALYFFDSDALYYLGLRNDAGELEKRRAIEKMLFHISTNIFKSVIRFLRFDGYGARTSFLPAALSAGVNRFGIDDMVIFFDEYLEHVKESSAHNILKPIMEALLKSKRVNEEDIVNRVFKKHLREFYQAKNTRILPFRVRSFQGAMNREYFEVMDGKITAEDYRLAGAF